jgi:Holliday junction resolvasome RuvABC endonuclease subunit
MKGISLDIAPTHSAVVFWQDEEIDDFSHTVIKTGKIVDMERWLTETICRYEILEGVDWVAVEKSIYINNARNTINLGKLIGAIEITCDQLMIQYFEGTTAEIDSANCVDHQQDRKTQNRNLAEILLPERKLNEDECDAVAIGLWGWGKFRQYQFNKEALE